MNTNSNNIKLNISEYIDDDGYNNYNVKAVGIVKQITNCDGLIQSLTQRFRQTLHNFKTHQEGEEVEVPPHHRWMVFPNYKLTNLSIDIYPVTTQIISMKSEHVIISSEKIANNTNGVVCRFSHTPPCIGDNTDLTNITTLQKLSAAESASKVFDINLNYDCVHNNINSSYFSNDNKASKSSLKNVDVRIEFDLRPNQAVIVNQMITKHEIDVKVTYNAVLNGDIKYKFIDWLDCFGLTQSIRDVLKGIHGENQSIMMIEEVIRVTFYTDRTIKVFEDNCNDLFFSETLV
ncbi:hypothetical protein [Trichoplusia ni ascovirus 2c]|uniref:hypothetical protein n=1 Tax=Trichoplusia ni ascovirus 2c TaxID=328615 RepID=UPI0000E441EC|nr:hypothetical protein TNAV2c_gp020 [Trichoplusia ni ascovirus 2c]ABF70537.1 hypothetical protein [Trichoplusia ni ascovirus 2c]